MRWYNKRMVLKKFDTIHIKFFLCQKFKNREGEKMANYMKSGRISPIETDQNIEYIGRIQTDHLRECTGSW